jgi:hypothetical protein
MKNPYEKSANQEDLDSAMKKEVVDFIRTANLTSEETFKAYELALGFEMKETGGGTAREEVYKLAKLLEGHMDRGLPLNAVVELIESRSDFERLEETYYETVNQMNISDSEKKVLHSIVKDVRSGELSIMDTQSKREIAEVKIPAEIRQEKNSRRILAASLLDVFQRFRGRKIEIIFSS